MIDDIYDMLPEGWDIYDPDMFPDFLPPFVVVEVDGAGRRASPR
jgi:hypothetical protein